MALDVERVADSEEGDRGYDRLAELMGEVPDMTAFRSFQALSAESLLHRQAELVDLEQKLRQSQERDRKSGNPDRIEYACDFDTLQASADTDADEGNDPETWKLFLELRSKLRDYHEALLLHRSISSLQQPHPRHLQSLVDWMERPTMGNIRLSGVDHAIWRNGLDYVLQRDSQTRDLVSLGPPPRDGFSTSTLSLNLAHLYHHLLGRHIHSAGTGDHLHNTIIYHDEGVFAVVKTVKTIAACLLPILAIVILYLVEDMPKRLGIIAAFTVIFAVSLDRFTSAPIKDIFSATAAFAAVLVVFVGTNNGPTTN